MSISRERAERIARAHACRGCLEYSYRKVALKAGTDAVRDALGVVWTATLLCGVCGAEQELGIDDDGDVVYVG
jgi:hypothetical protein